MVNNRRTYPTVMILSMSGLLLFCGVVISPITAVSDALPEYEAKAGFLYKLLFFVDWPEEAFSTSEDIISIGILGKDPFGDYFDPVSPLIIPRFLSFSHFKTLV